MTGEARVVALVGQNAGPGDRSDLIERAREHLAPLVGEVSRIDVPAKGTAGDGTDMRPPVDSLVPALQSGSLFGGDSGILVIDADQLTTAEAAIIGDLLSGIGDSTAVAFVAFAALPAALATAVRAVGEVVRVQGLTSRQATPYAQEEARRRGLRLDADVVGALVQRFGADRGALTQALDQLAADGEAVSAGEVLERFTSRPDEPMWFLTDAVVAGDTTAALRRLADFLTHGHPLALLAYLQGEVRLHALASNASDFDTFVSSAGKRHSPARLKRVWNGHRNRNGTALSRALGALARADRILKTAPEPIHRVTLERLTVALCMWYGRS